MSPRVAISLPPKGSCSNPIVSWFTTIQLFKKNILFSNKEQQQIAENSSNQLCFVILVKELQKIRQINLILTILRRKLKNFVKLTENLRWQWKFPREKSGNCIATQNSLGNFPLPLKIPSK